MLPWATENAVVGHMWPASCYLPTPALWGKQAVGAISSLAKHDWLKVNAPAVLLPHEAIYIAYCLFWH